MSCHKIVLGFCALIAVKPVAADPVTFRYMGTIESVVDANSVLDGSVTVGAAFWGDYAFDSMLPDSDPSPYNGQYSSFPYGVVSLSLGNYQIASRYTILVQVANVTGPIVPITPADRYSVIAYYVPFSGVQWPLCTLSVQLADYTMTALANDALPTVPPDLSLFQSRQFTLGQNPDLVIKGRITSLTFAPPPPTWWDWNAPDLGRDAWHSSSVLEWPGGPNSNLEWTPLGFDGGGVECRPGFVPSPIGPTPPDPGRWNMSMQREGHGFALAGCPNRLSFDLWTENAILPQGVSLRISSAARGEVSRYTRYTTEALGSGWTRLTLYKTSIEPEIPGNLIQLGITWASDPGETRIDNFGAYQPFPLLLPLDILPDECPNLFTVNQKGKGRLPMAILGTASVGVSQIDRTTLKIGGVAVPVKTPSVEDKSGPANGNTSTCACPTGPDGLADLSVHFSRQDLVQALGLDQMASGTVVAITIEGYLLDGTPFEATDCVQIKARD